MLTIHLYASAAVVLSDKITEHFEVMLRSFEVIWGPLWIMLGSFRGSCRGHVGTVLGSFWDRVGVVLWSSLGSWGPFRWTYDLTLYVYFICISHVHMRPFRIFWSTLSSMLLDVKVDNGRVLDAEGRACRGQVIFKSK